MMETQPPALANLPQAPGMGPTPQQQKQASADIAEMALSPLSWPGQAARYLAEPFLPRDTRGEILGGAIEHGVNLVAPGIALRGAQAVGKGIAGRTAIGKAAKAAQAFEGEVGKAQEFIRGQQAAAAAPVKFYEQQLAQAPSETIAVPRTDALLRTFETQGGIKGLPPEFNMLRERLNATGGRMDRNELDLILSQLGQGAKTIKGQPPAHPGFKPLFAALAKDLEEANDIVTIRRMQASMGQPPGATEPQAQLMPPRPGVEGYPTAREPTGAPAPSRFEQGVMPQTRQMPGFQRGQDQFIFRQKPDGGFELVPKVFPGSTVTPPGSPANVGVVQGVQPYVPPAGQVGTGRIGEGTRPVEAFEMSQRRAGAPSGGRIVTAEGGSPNLPIRAKDAPRMKYQAEDIDIQASAGPHVRDRDKAMHYAKTWDNIARDFEEALVPVDRAEVSGARKINAQKLLDNWRKDSDLRSQLTDKDWENLNVIMKNLDKFDLPAKRSRPGAWLKSAVAGSGVTGFGLGASAAYLLGAPPVAAGSAGTIAGVGMGAMAAGIGRLLRTNIGRNLLRATVESAPLGAKGHITADAIANLLSVAELSTREMRK
jgi:hypothetical protein